jgi:hypothetical protein
MASLCVISSETAKLALDNGAFLVQMTKLAVWCMSLGESLTRQQC